MNKNSKQFFNFFDRFLNISTKRFNIDSFNELSSEFASLLNYDEMIKNSPVKSFFTFDQQIPSIYYNPKNQDLNKNYEFVFSGCSQTQGHYLCPPLVKNGSHKNIWGFQIADKYEKQALNLGMGGWSAQAILKGLMHHFIKNGNPKVLFVLYPDFGRVESVDSDKTTMPKRLNNNEIVQHWFLMPEDDHKVNKISTLPHDPINVIPWTFALYHNLQSIIMLDQYCKQNNIYFKYSSWDNTSNIILKLLKEHFVEYSNYCEPTTLDFSKSVFAKMDCHKNRETSSTWNIASDNKHIGIHQHLHIAELFMSEVSNDNPWNK